MTKQTIELSPADDVHEHGIHLYEFKEDGGVLGFRFSFDRLYDEKDAIWCELSIERTYYGVDDPPRHIFGPERLNLLAGTWRRTVRNELIAMTEDYDWETVLSGTITDTVRHHRSAAGYTSYKDSPDARPDTNPFLLEPFIASSGVTVLYGEGGVGKSTMAVAMGLAVASGQPLWGTFPTMTGNVLYVDYEDEDDIHYERLDALLKGFGMKRTDVGHDITHVPLVSKVAQAQHDLRRVVMEHEAKLVILDSIGLARGGDAMGADDTIRLFRALRGLGAPVLALDHITKEDKRGKKIITPYGSVYTINTARLLWGALLAEDESTATHRQVNMENTKANRVALQPRCGFAIEYHNDANQLVEKIDMVLNAGDWAPSKHTTVDSILSLMDEQPYRYWTLRELSLALKLEISTVEKATQRAMATNEPTFDRKKVGTAYAYRQAGIADDTEGEEQGD